jgi:hypothetical protein
MWTTPSELSVGADVSFRNKQSGSCIDVAGITGNGDIATYTCDGRSDQRWKWVNSQATWTTPLAKWNMIGCNNNGGVSYTVTSGTSYTSELTLSVSVTVGASMEASCGFATGTVSTEVSTSLSNTWSNTYDKSASVTYDCVNYDN